MCAGEEFENIQFKPIDSGLGFHKTPSTLIPLPGVEEFIFEAGVGKEKKSPFHPNTSSRSWLQSLLIDQLFVFFIFFVLCLAPFFQFHLFRHPEKAVFFFQKSILISFGILLCVVEAFYYLFFKQFKLPRFGIWITELKSDPKKN